MGRKSIGLNARVRKVALGLAVVGSLSVAFALPAAQAAEAKPRTIVTTDPELDDLNSLVRMLLYSNEIDIEGLVYASGTHHYQGDPARGIPPYRWKAGQSHIEDALDAYDQVDENLRVQDPAFPTAAQLRSKYRVGNIKVVNEMTESTPGSQLIADVLLDDKPGPVFLQAWGGVSTIARGLKDIEDRYRNTPQWDAIYAKVSKKAIINRWGAQDNTYASYIAPNWPLIENRQVNTGIYGYSTRGQILPADRFLVDAAWTRENVTQVGALGSLYRVWGDGKFMAQDAGPAFEKYPRNNRCMENCPPGPFFDDEDFFGFDSTQPGITQEALRARGYNVWTALQEPGSFISEGDSSAFTLLIDNGLRSHENARWGGWGGRQVQGATNPSLFAPPAGNAGDLNPATGTRPNGFHASRWWRAVQMDFAERLRWGVTPTYAAANHEPAVTVAGGLSRIAATGEQVRLSGAATDPDGDALTYRWWHYPEAGTYTTPVALTDSSTAAAGFVVPADAQPGQTLHMILEVTDDGPRPLTSYQRVIVTVVNKDEETGQVGGTVPATLSLALGTPASFGAFTPGLAKDYFANTSATIISTAGEATLSVADPSSTATGRLVNGSFALASPLQAGTGGSFAAVGGASAPTAVKTWSAPVSNDPVTVAFRQSIAANEPLRTGSYSKTLTFTLSTTTP